MPVVAVNDAYRLFPGAVALYACDEAWWNVHEGCPGFSGEKWSSHGSEEHNDKRACAARWGLRLVQGEDGDTFALKDCIRYGSNSGFQAINLAILFGATRIVLVGFNMQVSGKRHFFGDHPEPLSNTTNFVRWAPKFEAAARALPPHIEIINATPNSALSCFPRMDLCDALSDQPSIERAHHVAASDRPGADQDALRG